MLVAQRFFSTPGFVGFATGTDFADALCGGVRAGVEGGGELIYSSPRRRCLPCRVARPT